MPSFGRRTGRPDRTAPALSIPKSLACLLAARRYFLSRGAPSIPPAPPPALLLGTGLFLHRDETGAPRRVLFPCSVSATASPACETTRSWRLLIGRIQNQSHGAREGLPLRLFRRQVFPSKRREAII